MHTKLHILLLLLLLFKTGVQDHATLALADPLLLLLLLLCWPTSWSSSVLDRLVTNDDDGDGIYLWKYSTAESVYYLACVFASDSRALAPLAFKTWPSTRSTSTNENTITTTGQKPRIITSIIIMMMMMKNIHWVFFSPFLLQPHWICVIVLI